MRPLQLPATHPSGAQVAMTTRRSVGALVATIALGLGLGAPALARRARARAVQRDAADLRRHRRRSSREHRRARRRGSPSRPAGCRPSSRSQLGDWAPAHEDSDAAGFAVLFEVGGQARYVRVETPPRPGTIRYDYGTWTPAGGFVSAGATTGEVADGVATATIDVPAATGASAGVVLVRPFVMTYDGRTIARRPALGRPRTRRRDADREPRSGPITSWGRAPPVWPAGPAAVPASAARASPAAARARRPRSSSTRRRDAPAPAACASAAASSPPAAA